MFYHFDSTTTCDEDFDDARTGKGDVPFDRLIGFRSPDGGGASNRDSLSEYDDTDLEEPRQISADGSTASCVCHEDGTSDITIHAGEQEREIPTGMQCDTLVLDENFQVSNSESSADHLVRP